MVINFQNKDRLFEGQKNLVRTISFVTAAIILIAGTVQHLVAPETAFSIPLRLTFVFMFLFNGHIAGKKNVSSNKAEFFLALLGSVLVGKLLNQFYDSSLSPILLVSSVLAIVGLSGVFLNKSSIVLLALPVTSFIFLTTLYPIPDPAFKPSISFTFLIIASIAGYFLTWQKVRLVSKVLEQEIHKNTILHNMSEGIVLRDKHGIILTINPAASEIIELSENQIVGKKISDIPYTIFKDDGETPLPFNDFPSEVAARTGQSVKDFQLVVAKSDNTKIHLEMTSTPIMASATSTKVEAVLTTFRDVTELKKARNEIENHKIQMLAHSKLTALGEMASGIAHEINNPLTIIVGRAQHGQNAVESGTATAQDTIQNFEKIMATAMRIARIVKSMKSLSRDSLTDEYSKSNLKSIIDDIVNVSNDYIQSNEITVNIDINSSTELECNSGLLSQVFINLMGNAIDALKDLPIERWIRINSKIENGLITVCFHDSGPGIPPNLREKIMLPFFTTKEAGKGTGIGLSLCRTIIENHKGKFFIDETVSNTCFVVQLPVEQNRSTKSNAA